MLHSVNSLDVWPSNKTAFYVLFSSSFYTIRGTDFPPKDFFRASVEQSKDSLSAGNKSLFVEVTTTFMPIASQF